MPFFLKFYDFSQMLAPILTPCWHNLHNFRTHSYDFETYVGDMLMVFNPFLLILSAIVASFCQRLALNRQCSRQRPSMNHLTANGRKSWGAAVKWRKCEARCASAWLSHQLFLSWGAALGARVQHMGRCPATDKNI